ncbi:MAG: hypothetical protein A3G37_03140 [Omnitrophica WOR_2 bacterium RIFCSPLOWO2_12_FULL_46_30]|nr:MAG: hypothetical protein A3H41_04220 [Omnitrophica WOR_2 bacterium RIFCSPLOWO2_02_FULL_45_28]OGX50599.1 MAG: hypothetical protein A3G37_03140 [Omnitrophica WOR_2 bacterium RIFCSPLOWO2_12_FULL_46_30]
MDRVGIIGFGNMGSAIAGRIKREYRVAVFDKDKNIIGNLTGIEAADNLPNLLKEAKTIILAVKPQDLDNILEGIRDCAVTPLIISIAAGITTGYIEKALGKARVIRVMPNMGARIGRSVTCLCGGSFAAERDILYAIELFNHLGITRKIEENMMNAVTAISGSGPAYYFALIESNPKEYRENSGKVLKDFIASLAQAAEGIGFGRKEAKALAVLTANCAQELLVQTKSSPSELIKQITSKGGTTEAALEVLGRGGSLEEAVKAALARAETLAKKE